MEAKSTKKIKPLLDFWENFVGKGSPKSGGIIKGFPIKSTTGGVKTKGHKVIQTRGTRVYKSKVKVKSTPDKTPLKGRLIQTKINLRPIKLNLIQDKQFETSTDELIAEDKGDGTVDRKLEG